MVVPETPVAVRQDLMKITASLCQEIKMSQLEMVIICQINGLWNDSDPYMEVDWFGLSVRMAGSSVGGNHNPEWNQVLNFGSRAWRLFSVKVYDVDWGGDNLLSNQQITMLSGYGSRFSLRHSCHRGYAVFDY